MVRNASAASALSKLASEKKNVHIVEADVTNLEQLKVCDTSNSVQWSEFAIKSERFCSWL
jgi:hypothetical protein